MVKKLTGKKETYVSDTLGFKLGGCYSFTPYDNIDRNGKTLIKVGFTTNFRHRFEDYYTSFTEGVYILNLLESPTKDIRFRDKDSKQVYTVKRVRYMQVEKFIMNHIIKNGGLRVKSTTRMRNADIFGGDTEWFYTNFKTVTNAFNAAQNEFGGRLHTENQDIKAKVKEDLAS